jgi:hypothetical protein
VVIISSAKIMMSFYSKDGNSQKNIYKCIDPDAAMTESKQHCYNIIEKVLCGILTNT